MILWCTTHNAYSHAKLSSPCSIAKCHWQCMGMTIFYLKAYCGSWTQIVLPGNYICFWYNNLFIFWIATLCFSLTKREGFHLFSLILLCSKNSFNPFQTHKEQWKILYRKTPLYVMHWRWHCSNNFTVWMIRYACVCCWEFMIFFYYLFSSANIKPKVSLMQHNPTLLL